MESRRLPERLFVSAQAGTSQAASNSTIIPFLM
jgi:hypothetical protein